MNDNDVKEARLVATLVSSNTSLVTDKEAKEASNSALDKSNNEAAEKRPAASGTWPNSIKYGCSSIISVLSGVVVHAMLRQFLSMPAEGSLTIALSAIAAMIVFVFSLSWLFQSDPALKGLRTFRVASLGVLVALSTTSWSVTVGTDQILINKASGSISIIAMVAILYMLWKTIK